MNKFKINEVVNAKINGIYQLAIIKSIVPNTNGTRYNVLVKDKEVIVNEEDIVKS